MTLPEEKECAIQQEFIWRDDDADSNSDSSIPRRSRKGSKKSIKANFIHGTTVVFDSFSAEDDVQARNLEAINVSKVKILAKRFSTDFVVEASGSVAAILSASTVAKYRIVDTNRQSRNVATSPPTIPSFISVLTSIPAKTHQSDEDLVTSLIEAARDTPSKLMASISLDREASPGETTPEPDEHLHKRCKTMVQQKLAWGEGRETVGSSTVKNHSATHELPSNSYTRNGGRTLTRACPAVPFFTAVLRPIAVQKALEGFDRPGKRASTHGGISRDAETSGDPIRRTGEQNEHGEPSPFPGSMDRLFNIANTPESDDTPQKSAFSHVVGERRNSSSDVFFADTCFSQGGDDFPSSEKK